MITLEVAIAEAQKNDRVCPQPMNWDKLYKLLPNRTRKGGGWEPALPLILGAWWDTPDSAKQLRMQEHLEWADTHGVLTEVYEFMVTLHEEDWHHRK